MHKVIESASREKKAGGFSFEQVEKQGTACGVWSRDCSFGCRS